MRKNPTRKSTWGLTRGLTQDLTQGVLRSYLGSYPVSSRQLFAGLKRPDADRGWPGTDRRTGLGCSGILRRVAWDFTGGLTQDIGFTIWRPWGWPAGGLEQAWAFTQIFSANLEKHLGSHPRSNLIFQGQIQVPSRSFRFRPYPPDWSFLVIKADKDLLKGSVGSWRPLSGQD